MTLPVCWLHVGVKVDDSLSDGGDFIVSCSSCSSRRGGLEPVQHPGHGGDRAEQAYERPGLRGHPEAAHLRRWPRAEGHHAATPETLAGRDPEETGCCSREEEGVWSVWNMNVCAETVHSAVVDIFQCEWKSSGPNVDPWGTPQSAQQDTSVHTWQTRSHTAETASEMKSVQ